MWMELIGLVLFLGRLGFGRKDMISHIKFYWTSLSEKYCISNCLNMALIQMANKKKTCRYCQQAAHLLHHGAAGYPYHRDYGPMWVCIPCSYFSIEECRKTVEICESIRVNAKKS